MKTKTTQTALDLPVAIAEKPDTTNTSVHTSRVTGRTSYQDLKFPKTYLDIPSNEDITE